MLTPFRKLSLAAFIILFSVPPIDAANVMFMYRDEFNLSEGDEAQIAFFENRGDTLDLWDNNTIQADPEGALDAAEDADLVWINESVSSGRVGAVQDTTTPIINNENFACDTLGFIDFGEDDDHGSPGTLNDNDDEIAAGTHFGTSLQIVNDQHPIARAAGLANGSHVIYDDQGLGEDGGGRFSWCIPNEAAEIIAIFPEFADTHPRASALFVHEAGDEMADGRIAEGLRIQNFLSDTNRGPAPADDPRGGSDGSGPGWEATLLTEAGLNLTEAIVAYALGQISEVPFDFDGNGELGVGDIDLLLVEVAARTNNAAFDVNGDGGVNTADVQFLVGDASTLNTWMGDANLDGEFNSGDFVQVFTAGLFETGNPATWGQGDWDGDGVFGSGDFVAAFTDGGFELGPKAQAAAVPEPSGFVLVLISTLTFVAFVRRTKS